MVRAIALQLATVALACALVTAYHIDPKTAAWSGKAHPGTGVSQLVTVCFDSLVYCEFFNGKGSNAGIDVSVLTYPGGYPVASGDTSDDGDHKWLRCYLSTNAPDSIVKGKLLEFRFTRSGSDSIQYYYQENDPYEYGLLIDRSLYPVPLDWDLACRVYGVMDTVGRDWVGMDPSFPVWEDAVGQNTRRVKWVGFCESAGVGLIRFTVNWAAMQ